MMNRLGSYCKLKKLTVMKGATRKVLTKKVLTRKVLLLESPLNFRPILT